ncbi:MAG: hypothetical protein ACLU5E_01685 [Anaerovoracaceae bacterium]
MGFKLELTPEGVNALRTWADSIPFVLTNIEESTQKLLNTVNSQDALGVHVESFREMFLLIERLKNDLNDAAEELPIMLNNTADRIECYIYNMNYEGQETGTSGWQKVRKR